MSTGIVDDDRGGPEIHVPEQNLHMRIVGHTASGAAVHRGTLDTSMGMVTVETDGDSARAWARHAQPYEVTTDMEGDEHVIGVEDQRVRITMDGDKENGTIVTSGGKVAFRDRH